MHFSICVCTYNRAHILPYCLESLTSLNIPTGYEIEILIVDNNSTDDTKDVAEQYSRKSPIPIFYFHESQQGISAARNRAIAEGRGEYIGFLDDECIVPPDWLEVVVEDIDEFAPLIIGGPYIGALLPATTSKWFRAEYGNAYFLANNFKRGFQKGFRASSGNMLIHRTVFQKHRFDPDYGMKGNELKLGEEVLLQERFLSENANEMVFYEPRIQVAHYILPQKMSLSYHARRQMEAGASTYKIGLATLSLKVLLAAAHLSLAPFRVAARDRKMYPYWQNYAYEKVIPRVMPVIGAAIEKFRKRYRSEGYP